MFFCNQTTTYEMRIVDCSSDVFSSDLRGSMLGVRTIARQLDRHLVHASFEQLALPCAVVAADLVTSDAVVLNTGNVAEAVRASMALPGIFHPVIRDGRVLVDGGRSEEHTSELQSLMRISYAVFCLKKKKNKKKNNHFNSETIIHTETRY